MADKSRAPLVGLWGGDRMNLVLTETGGHVQLDCASGTIAEAVRPDASGHFAASGSWETHRPGPQQADVAPEAVPVRFEGHVVDDRLSLAVTGLGEQQRYTLTRGKQVKLVRCL